MRKSSFYIACFSCLLLVQGNCNKEDEFEKINIEGFILTDNLGNTMGVHGSAGDDWKLQTWMNLTTREQSFLNFGETIDLNNTAVSAMINPVAYPNPCGNMQNLLVYSTDSVKVKVVVVDKVGNPRKTISMKFKGNQSIVLDYSDINVFPDGKDLRYYFSFSANGQPNFKSGYGDIKICRLFPNTQCF